MPSIIFQTIRDGKLWIRYSFYACPVSLTNISVINYSIAKELILASKFPLDVKSVVIIRSNAFHTFL